MNLMEREFPWEHVMVIRRQHLQPLEAKTELKEAVNQPNHYWGVDGLEVEVVLQNFLPKISDGYVSHRIGSAIEYILRHPDKNGLEDLKKAQRNLKQIIGYLEKSNE